MIPFFFGPGDRRLFAIFQPAHGAAPAAAAVLLCNPYGQEAIRTHRIYRVLADRLAAAGFDVMRFDYYGTGDSAGEDAEGELRGWARDLAAAHEELTRRSGSLRSIWMGARLGATLATQATAQVNQPPHRLVLWQPIVNGADYLRELAELHVQTLDNSYAGSVRPWRDMIPAGRRPADRECIGFELGDALRSQLSELTPATLTSPRTWHCALIEHGERGATAAIVEAWRRSGLRVSIATLTHDLDWTWQQPLESGLVPVEPLELLIEAMTSQ